MNTKVEDILKQIEDCTLSELKAIQLAQSKIAEQRTAEFIKAIEQSDLEKIKKLLLLEVNFEDPKLWSSFSRNTDLSKIKPEVIDYFMNLNHKGNPINSNVVCQYCEFSLTNSLTRHSNINPMDAFRGVIKEKLARYVTSSGLKEKDFNIAQKYLSKDTFSKLGEKIAERFAAYESIEDHQVISNYIEENPKLIQILFNSIKTEKNINSFMKNNTYKKFLETYLKSNSTDEMMGQAIADASSAKISFLYNMGVDLPNEKAPYSTLFMKTSVEALEAQRYIVRTIEDITFGNQVILKTILHGKRSFASYGDNPDLKLELIKEVLNKYNLEQLDLLPEALKKRTPNDETELVQKFHDYSKFRKEIEASPDSINGEERKKLKI